AFHTRRKPAEDRCRGPGLRITRNFLYRLVLGSREIGGYPVDHNREQHANDHRRQWLPDDIAAVDVRVAHVGDGEDGKQRDADRRRGVETARDGLQRVAPTRRSDEVGADDGTEHADTAYDQREYDPDGTARDGRHGQTKDQARNNRHFIALEDVRRHTRAVADVVANQVSDDCRVTRVVFRQTCLDLADKVRADIRRFGIDTAANTHEQRQQRAAKAEPKQRVGRGDAEQDENDRAAEQPQTVGQHAGDGAGTIGDTQGIGIAALRVNRRSGNTHIALNRHVHADETDHRRKDRAHQECAGAANGCVDARRVARIQPVLHDGRFLGIDNRVSLQQCEFGSAQAAVCRRDLGANGVGVDGGTGFFSHLRAEVLDGVGRRVDDIDAEEQHDYQNQNQNGDNAKLRAQIRVSAGFDITPDFLHAGRSFAFGKDLPREPRGIQEARHGNAQNHEYQRIFSFT